MNERNKPHICKNCVHSIIYCELDENMELNNEKHSYEEDMINKKKEEE